MGQRSNQLADHTTLPTALTLLTDEEAKFEAEIDAFQLFIGRLDDIPRRINCTTGSSLTTTIQSWFQSS